MKAIVNDKLTVVALNTSLIECLTQEKFSKGPAANMSLLR